MLMFSIKLNKRRVVAKPNAIHNMCPTYKSTLSTNTDSFLVCVVFELLSLACLLCIVLHR